MFLETSSDACHPLATKEDAVRVDGLCIEDEEAVPMILVDFHSDPSLRLEEETNTSNDILKRLSWKSIDKFDVEQSTLERQIQVMDTWQRRKRALLFSSVTTMFVCMVVGFLLLAGGPLAPTKEEGSVPLATQESQNATSHSAHKPFRLSRPSYLLALAP